MKLHLICLLCISVCLFGCERAPGEQANSSSTASPTASVVASPGTAAGEAAKIAQPVTLPVLDAFFADQSFSDLLRSRLQLTDEQVTKLRDLAHAETARLSETEAGHSEGESAAAREAASEKIGALIGAEKADQLAALVREKWNEDSTLSSTDKSSTPTKNPTTPEEFAALAPNTVPTDSRVVVNAPAFRMDVFESGRLVKSYKIGIGYPQFPLPKALRKAGAIIFNPTWTPPDEPWVAKMNMKAGEKVDAGSPLNPLGPIKIPIGQPSLIHGGKPLAKIGTFASHGCVGMTTPQVRDFAKLLAQIAGNKLGDADLARYAQDKTHTRQLKLNKDIPVELRYETIVVEDGKLHIYRDVYDQDSNTQEALEAVLSTFEIKLEDLTADEQDQVFEALSQLAGKSTKKFVRPVALASASPASSPTPSPSPSPSVESTPPNKKAVAAKKPTRKKFGREVVIEIGALSGKGYPAAVDLDTGGGRKAKAQVAAKAKPATEQ